MKFDLICLAHTWGNLSYFSKILDSKRRDFKHILTRFTQF